MMWSQSYRTAFIVAIVLHVLVALMLFMESSSEHPVLTAATHTEAAPTQPLAMAQSAPAIQAVSVDSKDVMETVHRLQEEKKQQQKAEANRQNRLKQQADMARKQRIAEQQRVEALKTEVAKLAIAHKKQMEEEQRHLKELAKQSRAEAQRLADMKKQQQKEAEQLAELKKKALNEAARAERAKQEKAKESLAQQKKDKEALIQQAQARDELEKRAKATQALAKKQQALAEQAALNAQNQARMAGEVDKYKALIIQAISRQWILPENAKNSLSSQFRIRLAPNGMVLEVNLMRSSGDPVLDRSAQSAIYKASPLPVPSDPDAFYLFRDISLTVRPENARG